MIRWLDLIRAATAAAVAAGLPGSAADPPGPQVAVSFPPGANLYHLQLRMTTASGRTYDFGPQPIQAAGGKDARALVAWALQERRWDALLEGDFRLKIRGYSAADGSLDPVADVAYTVYRSEATPFEVPRVSAARGPTVTEALPARAPPAPALGNSPMAFVSFPPGVGVKVALTLTTAGGDTSTSEAVPVNEAEAGKARAAVRRGLPAGWVAQDLGDGGLLVLGRRTKDGKLDPVASLTYTSAPLGADLVTPDAQLCGLGGAVVRRARR